MNVFGKAGWIGLLAGLVLGGALVFALLGLGDSTESQPQATVVVNAFHWGWVPEVLEPGPGARVEIAPGAQGSQIFVPQGTEVTLVLRNAAGNAELHETYEDRFRDFFVEEYGDAWMGAHEAGHEEDEEGGEHEEGAPMDEQQLAHAYSLPAYDIDVLLPHEPESNVQIVRFVADEAGEFRFLCTNFCGVGHGDMTGVLVVR